MMRDNPFELLADYETAQALDALTAIARGRTLPPSAAAKVAETMAKYPGRFSEALVDSDELLCELHDTLLSPAEYLFGHGISEGACEND